MLRQSVPWHLCSHKMMWTISLWALRIFAANMFWLIFGHRGAVPVAAKTEKYLWTLPATGRHEQAKDLGIHPPEGKIEKQCIKALNPGPLFTWYIQASMITAPKTTWRWMRWRKRWKYGFYSGYVKMKAAYIARVCMRTHQYNPYSATVLLFTLAVRRRMWKSW